MRKNIIAQNLAVFGLTHALVDATCAVVVLSMAGIQNLAIQDSVYLIVLYNVLAFALQVPLGLLVDKYRNPRAAAILGGLLVALSTGLVFLSPIFAVITAGIGNALFHLGGGTISLNLMPGRATPPGIFVAPGAVGLFAGGLIAKSGNFQGIWFFGLIILACLAMAKVEIPKINYMAETAGPKANYLEMAILLLFISIVVRSLVGSVLAFPWKSDFSLVVVMVFAVLLGKALGGVLADMFGWRKVAAGALLASAPLVTFGAATPEVAIMGLFLFNMTMPVTLTAISNMLPGRPGFAFGLNCLALIIGAFPSFTKMRLVFVDKTLILLVVLASVGALYYGLGMYSKSRQNAKPY